MNIFEPILTLFSKKNHFNEKDLYHMIRSFCVKVDTSTVEGQEEAYRKSSVVQSVIRMRANAHSNLKVWAVDDDGNEIKNPTVKSDLKLLEQFNPYENFRKFNHHLMSVLGIFGVAYIYKMKIIGTDKFDSYIIPNYLINPIYEIGFDKMFQRKVLQYDISLGGQILHLSPDDVFIITDKNLRFDGYGVSNSRLVGLKEPISTLLAIGQFSTQLISDGGARGILSLGAKDVDLYSSPFLSSEVNTTQESLQKYGGLENQFKYIVVRSAASYVPMTSKIADMQLPELGMDAKLAIYEAYGIPNAFAIHESRFKVLPEARKELYTSTTIPEGEDIYADLIKLKQIPERPWKYTPDWSHMDFFQEGLKDSAVAFQQASGAVMPLVDAGIITVEEAKNYLTPYLK